LHSKPWSRGQKGANAIIALRCSKLSGRFEDFWERRSDQSKVAAWFSSPKSGVRPLACGTVEVRHLGELVGLGQSLDDLLIDLGANSGSAFERHHVFEAGALWNGDRRMRHTRVLVADVLNEKQNEDVVLSIGWIQDTTLPARG
jgi:hypothetical protein